LASEYLALERQYRDRDDRLVALIAEYRDRDDRLVALIAEIRDLHYRADSSNHAEGICLECSGAHASDPVVWPCPTARLVS
jgi:hypothetical protein